MASKSSQYGLGGILSSPDTYGYSNNPSFAGVDKGVVGKFGQLQNAYGKSLSVNSGYRSPSKNAKVGGAKRSQHMKGLALDISTKGMTRDQVRGLIEKASAVGYTGIGVYGNAIHVDTGPKRAWGPSYKAASVPGWAKDTISAHLSGVFSKNPTQYAAVAPSVPSLDRVATPTQNPRTMTAAVAPVSRAPLGPVKGFTPGGVLAAPDVSFSPVSAAQAAPSPGAMFSQKAQAMTAPAESRFGPTTQNVAYSALGPALSSQQTALSAPSQARFGPVAAPNETRAQLASALTSQAQLAAAPQAFSQTPASYQTPAFSTQAPKMDAFGLAPHPGLQPAKPSAFTPSTPTAPALASTPQSVAPAISPPDQVASQISPSRPAIEAPAAPAPNPALDQFPDAPKTSLMGSLFGPSTKTGLLGQLTGATLGAAAFGPIGGVLGGLLGKSVGNMSGGLLGGYTGGINNIGTGSAAVNSVMGGAPVGTQATTSSGQTVTSVPGGVARTSAKYGWTEVTDSKTGRTSFNPGKGKGGNYGGIQSGGVRGAMDSASAAGKSGVGSSGGLY